jgi:hypothetical protein
VDVVVFQSRDAPFFSAVLPFVGFSPLLCATHVSLGLIYAFIVAKRE